MNFIKWPSIENSYRTKYINKMVSYYPELLDEKYIITEKIDGSNFQWAFSPDGSIRVGSRNQWIDINGSFQGANIKSLYNEQSDFLENVLEFSIIEEVKVRLYGELYGEGIQKRVNYGKGKSLRYFGMMIEESWYSPAEFRQTVIDLNGGDFIVPVIEYADSLDVALGTETKFNTLLMPFVESNITEGVIIQPFYNVYLDQNKSPFILKKKNEQFGEKSKSKKKQVFDSQTTRLNAEFKTYITENRIDSVFSQNDAIQSQNEIGKYIKFILEDAIADFEKENDVSGMDKSQLKSIYNVGGIIANMLKHRL